MRINKRDGYACESFAYNCKEMTPEGRPHTPQVLRVDPMQQNF